MNRETERKIDERWIQFLRNGPQKDDFIRVIRTVPMLRRQAWHELMETGRMDIPSKGELILLMEEVPDLREEIWQCLLRFDNLVRDELEYIMEHVPDYADAAMALMPPPKDQVLKELESLSMQ